MNDNVFDALSHEQRRTLLGDRLESDPQDAGFESLTGESAPAEAEKRVQIATYHGHVPGLENYGHTKWNRDAHEVLKRPRFEEIQSRLGWVDDNAKIADQGGQAKP